MASTIFKDLLLLNRVTNQSQISCGATLQEGRTKVYMNGPGHMTKMAATPIYGKSLLLWNYKADDLETWHEALQVIHK